MSYEKPIICGFEHDLPVRTIYCIGRNYSKHAREMYAKVPEKPIVFIKPLSAISYHKDTISLPEESTDVHHEVELLVVIGKKGKNISSEQAIQYIAGYGIGIDFTARDLQQEAKTQGLPWSVAKGFDGFASISSFVPSDTFPDIQNVDFNLSVNGQNKQSSNSRHMIFKIPELVAYLSSVCTLYPGDLIFTGTPEGVGPVKRGDKLKAELAHQVTLNVFIA